MKNLLRTLVKYLSCAAVALTLASCGGGGGGGNDLPPAASCSTEDQRSWLRGWLQDRYFWNSDLRTPNEAATTMDAYFRSMLPNPPDRYSFSQTAAAYDQFYREGERTGYGYTLGWGDAAQTRLQVLYVEPASPVAAAGLRRGDTIVSIDGYTAAQVSAGSLTAVTTAGVTRTFTVRDTADAERTFQAVSRTFPLSPVLATSTFAVSTPAGSVTAGYVMFQEFINAGGPPLKAAFDGFRAAGVTELVVDLRYNGGGSLLVARNFASLVGGAAADGRTFAQLRFNARHAAENFTYLFNSALAPTAPLALTRVFVLTSASTASASEVFINSLKPFITVVQVGATTFGKPYGFQPRESCGIVYSAVNFDTVNAAGVGGFSSGITPACVAADDLSKQLGDAAEGRTAAAVEYMRTGACPATAAMESPMAARAAGGWMGEGARPAMRAD